MKELNHARLMQFYDGELSASDAIAFQAELTEHGLEDEAREVMAGLDQVGDVIRALADSDAEARAEVADQIADRVLERLPLPGPASSRRSAARIWGWSAGVGALALAAAALLVIWAAGGPSTSQRPLASGPTAAERPVVAASVAADAPAGAESDPGVAIEVVDFGAHGGTIFMVSSGEETPTPVVWLVDEGPDSQDRVEQL